MNKSKKGSKRIVKRDMKYTEDLEMIIKRIKGGK
jgi:hypothetical protein